MATTPTTEVEGPTSYPLEDHILDRLEDIVHGVWKKTFGKEAADHFKNEVTDTFNHTHSDFFREYIGGHPRTLVGVSREIDNILGQIRDSLRWQKFRNEMNDTIESIGVIRNAVCLGLGQLSQKRGTQMDDIWLYQYAAFTYICNSIDEKQAKKHHDPMTRIFQDPIFDLRTKYLIQKISRENDDGPKEVANHPSALGMIDQDSFVFGIHLPARMWEDVLQENRHPRLLLANAPFAGGGWRQAIYEIFFEELCWNGKTVPNPKTESLIEQFQEFDRTHSKRNFPTVALQSTAIFAGTCVYWRSDKLDQEDEEPEHKKQRTD